MSFCAPHLLARMTLTSCGCVPHRYFYHWNTGSVGMEISKLQKAVAFDSSPQIYPISPRYTKLTMSEKIYKAFTSDQVTDGMLDAAAKLFSENYGTWGKQAKEKMGAFAKPGSFFVSIY